MGKTRINTPLDLCNTLQKHFLFDHRLFEPPTNPPFFSVFASRTAKMASSPNLSETASLPNVTYGFIGLGVMGYGMATNLRAKIPKDAALVVCELVEARRDQFISETEGIVRTANSPKAVSEQCVRNSQIFVTFEVQIQ